MKEIFALHRPYGNHLKVPPGSYLCKGCRRTVTIREDNPRPWLTPCPKCGGICYFTFDGIDTPGDIRSDLSALFD